MRLTSVQVARIREADTEFHSEIASRGALIHEATEGFVEAVLEIIRSGVAPAGASVPCGYMERGRQCVATADFIKEGRARCLVHRNML